MSDTIVKVENVSKKFCRSLKKSLWYGLKDLGSELIGRSQSYSDDLRADEFWAVKDVSFELKRGAFLGLIGRNGAGKTTLLKMLNGLIKPDRGRIELRGHVGALIALGAGFNPILTGRENIYINASVLGLKKKDINKKFDEIVDFSELGEFIDTPMKSYSSGMHIRLGFAVASSLCPDILLLDEILAVGDEGFQKKCLNKIGEMKNAGTAIAFISHNMHTISTFSNKLIMMDKGFHKEYDNPALGVQAYQKLCATTDDLNIEKICNGNGSIFFYNVEFKTNDLKPGDSFYFELKYHTNINYFDVDVDIAISNNREISFYFQATNKAFNKMIDLKKESKSLRIYIKDIRLNNVTGKVSIAIWSHNRGQLLFWWRIPFKSQGIEYATGNTCLDVSYEIL